MSELLNPLQIAGRLKKNPAFIVRVINENKITPQKLGLRAGLYDIEELKVALQRIESEKKPE